MKPLNSAQIAVNPAQSVIVSASAGSGKTFLLVSRLVRLLLQGAAPGGILAVTFTRKAAGEMRQRLQERLQQLALADEDTLSDLLQTLGANDSTSTRTRARGLYEQILFAEHPLRIVTFHAFCQELLQRFPLEADIPCAFELCENTGLLQEQAWEALFLHASKNPDSELSLALQILFEYCNGIHNTRAALLDGFLAQRSDWWAYTRAQNDPVAYASNRLQANLNFPTRPCADFLEQQTANLHTYAALLNQHATSSNLALVEQLQHALLQAEAEQVFAALSGVLLTEKNTVRKRSMSATLHKALGDNDAHTFLQLHEQLAHAVLETQEYLLQQQFLSINRAWYLAGQKLLEHYQAIKQTRRVLDFADLEWKTYLLLHHSNNALWVQYKLDQRIDHLLIDEFQDTNPTQWHMILPLLQEMAASDTTRQRSIFIVGDSKQSIYGFRRANPALLDAAGDWLQQHMQAQLQPLSTSWRSAPAIITFINAVFEQTEAGRQLQTFKTHRTHRRALWGQVECLPLIVHSDTDVTEDFRNPLLKPRKPYAHSAHYQEGLAIADNIRSLADAAPLIETGSGPRPLQYGDILILFRTRGPLADYEQALSQANIPFISYRQGGLLDNQEILDLEALLNCLIAPFNNTALAHTLRSPLFNACDEDLIALAAQKKHAHWYLRLQDLVQQQQASPALQRAHTLLQSWRELAQRLPTHDLLDRIYHQGEVLARYRACTPAAFQGQVLANLQRFIEVALEVDSGRYPSAVNFLFRIQKMRDLPAEQPDMPGPDTTDSSGNHSTAVRLMTIHAAKGLEAPIVFLADCASEPRKENAYRAIVNWPSEEQQPQQFMLYTTQNTVPRILQPYLLTDQDKQAREHSNLLYVALSRAKQMLVISGVCKNEKQVEKTWYAQLNAALQQLTSEGKNAVFTQGEILHSQYKPVAAASVMEQALPLWQKLKTLPEDILPATKHEAEISVPQQQRYCGLLIHDYLQKQHFGYSPYQQYLNTNDIHQCRQQAAGVLQNKNLAFLFDSRHFLKAYNEMPVHYFDTAGHLQSGIVDRVVLTETSVWLIDYKTQIIMPNADIASAAEHHRPQIMRYVEALRKIWPAKSLRAGIIFTDGGHWHELANIPPAI